jgi:RNA-binding protein
MASNKKLTNFQIKLLKKNAHKLKPIVMISSNGLSESLINELENSLMHHELLKIKISCSDREDRKKIITYLLEKTSSHLIQSIGKVAVIFKQNNQTQINLPSS